MSVISDVKGSSIGVAMSSVRLAEGPRIGEIETIPFAALVAAAAAAERSSLVVGFLAALGALALAIVVARSLTKPLGKRTAAAERIFARRGSARANAIGQRDRRPGARFRPHAQGGQGEDHRARKEVEEHSVPEPNW